MKKQLLLLFLTLLVSISFLWAGIVSLSLFSAKSDGEVISIEWRANNESGLKSYEIERSFDGNSYSKVSTQAAKGSGFVYKFVDNDAFLKQSENEKNAEINAKQSYSYRLKFVMSDNSYEYSDVAYVKHNVNSMRRTWGMLKEMFK